MKIYLAGTFTDQAALREPANHIWQLGHEIVGTWLNETAKNGVLTDTEHKRKLAMKDLAEVMMADLIILDNRQSSGGKNCEWGIGLACFHHKLLWLVGEPTNVFHYLADSQFPTWDACLATLRGY
jgi:hypothetical protein